MRFKYYFIISAAVILTSCANSIYTYYETGRPKSVEMNNARHIVSNNWDIKLEYDSQLNLERINKHNDSISKILSENKGDNWINIFAKESKDELILNNQLRETIKLTSAYNKAIELLFEPIILLEKKGKKYLAHIVGQQKSDDTRKFVTFAQLLVNSDRTGIKIKDETIQELTISFPQNGIE